MSTSESINYIDWFLNLNESIKTCILKSVYNIYKNTKNIDDSIKILDAYEKINSLETKLEEMKNTETNYKLEILKMKNNESEYVKNILKENNDYSNKLLEKIKKLEVESEKNKIVSLQDIENFKNNYKNDIMKEIDNKYKEEIVKIKNENMEIKIKNTELETMYKSKLNNTNDLNAFKNHINEKLKVLDNFGGFKKGYKMENSVYNLLLHKYNYKDTMIKKVTAKNGCGDIELLINNIKYMFEVKSVNDKLLESNPDKIFKRFEKDSIVAYENNEIDVSVFVSNGSTHIPGHGVLDLKKIGTDKGPMILIYVSDIINNPDRLDAVIRLGDIMYNNMKNDEDLDNIFSLFESVISNINNLYEIILKNRKEREIRFQEQDKLITEQLFPLIDNIKKFTNKNSNEESKKDRLKNLIKDLLINNGYLKTTKKLLFEKMEEKQIPHNTINCFGNFQKLKRIVNNEIKQS
jgi:hypothetical protein